MSLLRSVFIGLLAASASLTALDAAVAQAPPAVATALPDGQHDFDFHLGSWTSHVRLLQHPLTGSTTWVELTGTLVARKIWDGRGQVEELNLEGGGRHLQDMLVFLYDPQTRQWSLNAADSGSGVLNPPMFGSFKNGRGEFYDQEPALHGRQVLVRQVWSDITPTRHRFEQSFSNDGGQTWEPNFVAMLTRNGSPAP